MKKDHIINICKAVDAQANDEKLWFIARYITESILQESLRDLHRVIERNDKKAFERIIARLKENR